MSLDKWDPCGQTLMIGVVKLLAWSVVGSHFRMASLNFYGFLLIAHPCTVAMLVGYDMGGDGLPSKSNNSLKDVCHLHKCMLSWDELDCLSIQQEKKGQALEVWRLQFPGISLRIFQRSLENNYLAYQRIQGLTCRLVCLPN